MKKIIGILVVSLLTISSFAQTAKYLQKSRDKEIKEIRKRNLPPAEESAELLRVDNYYSPLIAKAIEAEAAPQNPEATTTTKKVGGAGGTVDYRGSYGNFTGRSISTQNAANAYATVAQADANAYFTKSMADNSSGSRVTASANTSTGLEGVITNKFRYQELEVRIVGIGAGNTYQKTFLIGKEQSITDYLLPGKYQAYIRGLNNSTPLIHQFVVDPSKTHSINGRSVFWGLWGGNNW